MRKLLLVTAPKSALTKKILFNSTKPRPSTNIWMNGKMLEEAEQFKYLESTQTKNGTTSIKNKGSKDQTSTSTLSHDKANNAMAKPRHQFSCKY